MDDPKIYGCPNFCHCTLSESNLNNLSLEVSRGKRQRLTADSQDAVTTHEPEYHEEFGLEAFQNPAMKPKAKSLFVHSLPAEATNDTLAEHFSQSYPLKHATIVVDPAKNTSKRYGFVTFADADDAQSAKEAFNGSVLQGKTIKVELAEPRHRQTKDSGKASAASDVHLEKRRKIEDRRPPKLIVRNLPWSFKESEQLAQLFKSYGKVKFATLPKKQTGLSAGFGFVTLRGKKNAEKALEGINGKEVEGRTLAVDWAVEKGVWNTLQGQDKVEMDDVKDATVGQATDEGDGEHSSDDDSQVDQGEAGGVGISETEFGSATDVEEQSYSEDDGIASDLTMGKPTDETTTLFVRNVPFSVSDDVLQERFSFFGHVRYARVVLDPSTERSRGTAFVAFYSPEDARACLAGTHGVEPRHGKGIAVPKPSLLEDTSSDPSGHYTLDGRVLQLSRAVDRGEAKRLSVAGSSLREVRDKDKRRLYLLSEGTVSSNSPLYSQLSPTEIKIREDSAKQRQALIRSNPSLHLSLTRLSVRNLPRMVTSKYLKELARKAVVGFATDVKAGKRQPLSKEELARGGDASKIAERARKAKGKGIVKQAKIVFEGLEGSKVQEKSGAGRSRGYGFVEYTSHRWALMGLRWLNGHAVGPQFGESQQKAVASEGRKKRLMVEFAIENAQVVARRQERESSARETSRRAIQRRKDEETLQPSSGDTTMKTKSTIGRKRKRASDAGSAGSTSKPASTDTSKSADILNLSKRNQVVGKKRMMRKARRRGDLK